MTQLPSLLQTERLLLRPVDPAIAEVVNAAIRDSFEDLHRWLPWADHVPSVDETRAFLSKQQATGAEGGDGRMGIWLRATGDFAGSVGLHARPADTSWREIGYWIRSTHTRQGIATEAVRAVAEAGFTVLGLAGIQIRMSERNAASRRVAERAGFVLDAILEDGRVDPDGSPSRTLMFVRRNAG